MTAFPTPPSPEISRRDRAVLDVAIAGGGVGGLAAARALRARGLEVAVFERRPPPLRDAGVLILWANGVNALAALGLGQQIARRGVAVRRLLFRSWAGRLLADLDIGGMSERAGAPSLVVHRRDLLEVLAAGAGPREGGRAVTGFEEEPEAVRVLLDDGSRVRARALLAADGLESRIRALLLRDGPPRDAFQRAWVGTATLDHPDLEEEVTTVTHGRGARFCIASVRGRTVTWLASVNQSRLDEHPAPGRLSALCRIFADAHAPVPAILAATPTSEVFDTAIRYRPPVERWGSGRVTLIGDAAHPCTPDLAQGACQALEDAVVLGRVLSEPGNVVGALRRYESLRVAHASRVANISWIVQAQGAEESPLFGLARDLSTRLFLETVAAREIRHLLSHRP